DPSFQVNTDEETGQTIIAGMGELQLASRTAAARTRAARRVRRVRGGTVPVGRAAVLVTGTILSGPGLMIDHPCCRLRGGAGYTPAGAGGAGGPTLSTRR
ncbi:hypothetical protein AB0E96_40030, partial [Kitasatospora sp. NPDC036755]